MEESTRMKYQLDDFVMLIKERDAMFKVVGIVPRKKTLFLECIKGNENYKVGQTVKSKIARVIKK